MNSLYDVNAQKKPTNLTVNSDLLRRSKSLNINLSATLEEALNDKLKRIEAAKWKQENKLAIEKYNQYVLENGCFSDDYRGF